MLKIDNVKAGDVLVTDGGFTCIGADVEVVVKRDEHGSLYFECGEGKHHLTGQVDDERGILVGLRRPDMTEAGVQ